MRDLDHFLNDASLEFAKRVQTLLDQGWRLGEIRYGRSAWGILSGVVATRGDETREFTADQIDAWLADNPQA